MVRLVNEFSETADTLLLRFGLGKVRSLGILMTCATPIPLFRNPYYLRRKDKQLAKQIIAETTDSIRSQLRTPQALLKQRIQVCRLLGSLVLHGHTLRLWSLRACRRVKFTVISCPDGIQRAECSRCMKVQGLQVWHRKPWWIQRRGQ